MSKGTVGSRALIAVAGAVMLSVWARPVDAGSVFMKNGYIIQGPIVESDDRSIVLGWNNGQITIFRRFVDTIAYDPGEEDRLEAQRLEKQRTLAERDEILATQDGATDEIDELPAELEVFLALYASDSPLSASGDAAARSRSESTSPGVDVESVEPADRSEQRVLSSGNELSLVAPDEWNARPVSGASLAVFGPEVEGFSPSVNVVPIERGDLSFGECIEFLKDSQRVSIADFELITEGRRELRAGLEVFEIVGRGTMQNRMLVVRQVLVPRSTRLWLVSGFSTGATEDPAFAAVEASLATLEFSE